MALIKLTGAFFPSFPPPSTFIFLSWGWNFLPTKGNFFPFLVLSTYDSSLIDLCLSPKNVHFKIKEAFGILCKEVVHNSRRIKTHILFSSALKFISYIVPKYKSFSSLFFYNKCFLCVALYTNMMIFFLL